ncbi:unnamed protein product [Adineta steineri]|uniref:Attractin/MKLN-like beta-propeller domain-containing protein n=1 Tax=Adineta steineri TaxID=433720 RepID=A0A819TK51_9BILA|nr:unnamed protein product [Adineta steineri]
MPLIKPLASFENLERAQHSSLHMEAQERSLYPTSSDETTPPVELSNVLKKTIDSNSGRSKRFRALDTLRGLIVMLMIFVNYGGGGYWFFHHAALSSSHLGLATDDSGPGLETVLLLGVLQRLALCYFFTAIIVFFVPGTNDEPNTTHSVIGGKVYRHWRIDLFNSVLRFWLQWLCVLLITIAWLLITFLLNVSNCPKGYLGPGGKHEHGKYQNCTGGAARYLDQLILTDSHMARCWTCRDIYNTQLSFVSEDWSKTGDLNYARRTHTASVLANGKVLITGGLNNEGFSNSTELYDPLAQTWTITGSMNNERAEHTASVLANGKVLVTGGLNNQGYLNSTELYDPSTETWTITGNMNRARAEHTASVLANGKVLVAGGLNNQDFLNSTELYDPSTEIWTITSSMIDTRAEHIVSVLTNGKVLVAGGYNSFDRLHSGELYDLSTETWATTDSMNYTRIQFTASVLINGKVLVTGGWNYNFNRNSAELYDPSNATWTITGSMNYPRWKHTSSVLKNGKVLITGGFDHYPLDTAELYDPSTETWAIIGRMSTARGDHTASVLGNGNVLVTGGVYNGEPLNSTELYKSFQIN